MYTSKWMNSEQLGLLKTFDLSPQQYNVPKILRGQLPNPIIVNELF